MNNEMQIGPLQLLVVGFEGPDFTGKIADELDKARKGNLIRVVDSLGVYKEKSGELQVRQKSDLSFEEIGAYGAVLGALLGIGSGDENVAKASAAMVKQNFEERYEFGLDKEDIEDIANELPKDSAALFLLIEHLWAIPIRDAMREAGGMLVSQDFLSPELLVGIGQQAYASAAT